MPISKNTHQKTLGALFWEKHVKNYKTSQLSQGEYCKKNSLKLSAFGYWYRKLNFQVPQEKNKGCRKSDFIEISSMVRNTNQSTNPTNAFFEIELGNGWKIKIPTGWDPESLKQLLALLKEEACL